MARLVSAAFAVFLVLTLSGPEAWAQRKDDDKPGRQKAGKADKKGETKGGGQRKGPSSYDIKDQKKS